MSQVEKILREILQNQKKLAEDFSLQKKLIQNIEERLNTIESRSSVSPKETSIPTSLMRVLKGLAEEDKPVSAEEAAKRINLSRNLTSGYLNRLADLGYAAKEPNMEGQGPRYLFKANYSSIPENVKEMLKRYKR
jgi:response regulator of citrate/malate metabolism